MVIQTIQRPSNCGLWWQVSCIDISVYSNFLAGRNGLSRMKVYLTTLDCWILKIGSLYTLCSLFLGPVVTADVYVTMTSCLCRASFMCSISSRARSSSSRNDFNLGHQSDHTSDIHTVTHSGLVTVPALIRPPCLPSNPGHVKGVAFVEN